MVGNVGNWTPDADKSLACRPLLAIAGDGWNKALATSASAFCMPTSSSTSWRDVKLDQNHAISWSPPRQSPVVQRVACDRLNCAYSCINCTHTRSRETHTAHNTLHTLHTTLAIWRTICMASARWEVLLAKFVFHTERERKRRCKATNRRNVLIKYLNCSPRDKRAREIKYTPDREYNSRKLRCHSLGHLSVAKLMAWAHPCQGESGVLCCNLLPWRVLPNFIQLFPNWNQIKFN